MLSASLSNRSDLRGLAYVATAEAYSWGSCVYAAHQPCLKQGSLYVIQEGGCRVSAGWGQGVVGSAGCGCIAGEASAWLPVVLRNILAGRLCIVGCRQGEESYSHLRSFTGSRNAGHGRR